MEVYVCMSSCCMLVLNGGLALCNPRIQTFISKIVTTNHDELMTGIVVFQEVTTDSVARQYVAQIIRLKQLVRTPSTFQNCAF